MIAKRSKKRAKQEREYAKKRKAYLTDNDVCLAFLEGCTLQATDVHHKKGRCGNLLTDENYFLAVCRNCHHVLETSPKLAKELGLSISRLSA